MRMPRSRSSSPARLTTSDRYRRNARRQRARVDDDLSRDAERGRPRLLSAARALAACSFALFGACVGQITLDDPRRADAAVDVTGDAERVDAASAPSGRDAGRVDGGHVDEGHDAGRVDRGRVDASSVSDAALDAPSAAPDAWTEPTVDGIPRGILELPVAPTDWAWTTSSSWSRGINFLQHGSFIAESNAWNFARYGLDASDPSLQRVALGTAVGEGQVCSFRIETDLPSQEDVRGWEIRSYPSVILGQGGAWGDLIPETGTWWENVPVRVGDVRSLWAGYRSLTAGGDGKGHLSHDMRIVSDPRQTIGSDDANSVITLELMVVIDQFDGYGAHPDGRDPSRYRGTVSIAGLEWHVYLIRGAQTNLLVLIPARLPAPRHLDIGALLEWARSTRYSELPNGPGELFEVGSGPDDFLVDPDHWWISDTIGFETASGGSFWAELDSLYLRVNRD
jgi:hypothetical protein